MFLIALPDRDDLQDSCTDTDRPASRGNTRLSQSETIVSSAEYDNSRWESLDEPVKSQDPSPRDDWDFVWSSPRLSSGERANYEGIESDLVLETLFSGHSSAADVLYDTALFLRRLHHPEIEISSKRNSINTHWGSSCSWLLKHKTYLSWAQRLGAIADADVRARILNIFGQPGAGKSTLMNFVVSNTQRNLRQGEIVISHFFDARGGLSLQNSVVGMYRALLYQLIPKIDQGLTGLHVLQKYDPDMDSWTSATWYELFQAAVLRLHNNTLKCFIDGLDECEQGYNHDMMTTFHELVQKASEAEITLQVCIASRHYPYLAIESYYPEIDLDSDPEHIESVRLYLKDHLALRRLAIGSDAEDILGNLHERLIQKANGCFLWAILVARQYQYKYAQSASERSAMLWLKHVPSDLDGLFEWLLGTVRWQSSERLPCLRWMYFSKRSLSCTELVFEMIAGPEEESIDRAEKRLLSLSREALECEVIQLSQGLAEVVQRTVPTVQFIHSSVFDFLEERHSTWILEAHEKIKDYCQRYLSYTIRRYADRNKLRITSGVLQEQERESFYSEFPFVEYACQFVLHHAQHASGTIPQDDFLQAFPFEDWLEIADLLMLPVVENRPQQCSLLWILAEEDLPTLFRTVYEINPDDNLEKAIQCGHHKVVDMINTAVRTDMINKLEAIIEPNQPQMYGPHKRLGKAVTRKYVHISNLDPGHCSDSV